MVRRVVTRGIGVLVLGAAGLVLSSCPLDQSKHLRSQTTFFIGVDVSGSFRSRPVFADALDFLSRYIYAHLQGLGGSAQAKAMFVGAIGGNYRDDPQVFHSIGDFEDRKVGEIRDNLEKWFEGETTLTDFNMFFRSIADIAKERRLILSPISIIIVSDGIVEGIRPKRGRKAQEAYGNIDLSPLEFLARNVTLRLLYVEPQAGKNWKDYVPRRRVRVMTVPKEVMEGWRERFNELEDMERQDKLLKWIVEEVDIRVPIKKVAG